MHLYIISSILNIFEKVIYNNWRPPRKSGLTLKFTKAKVARYAITKSPQWL